MINILLEGFDIDAPWLYGELKNYIKPNHSVAVVAFSFRDNRVKSLSDWDALYGKVNGKYHDGIVGGFTAYGIPADKITFINYFTDTKETAAQKIKAADIIYFLGGLPDRMMDRIKEFDLYDVLMQHDGILMGYSAGAVIQLADKTERFCGRFSRFSRVENQAGERVGAFVGTRLGSQRTATPTAQGFLPILNARKSMGRFYTLVPHPMGRYCPKVR